MMSVSAREAGYASPPSRYVGQRNDSLADILERVLDRGVVIAGDIGVSVLDVEVLTLKVRLLIASADTAQQMGIDWWVNDPFLSSTARALQAENDHLRSRLEALENDAGRDPRAGNGLEAGAGNGPGSRAGDKLAGEAGHARHDGPGSGPEPAMEQR